MIYLRVYPKWSYLCICVHVEPSLILRPLPYLYTIKTTYHTLFPFEMAVYLSYMAIFYTPFDAHKHF